MVVDLGRKGGVEREIAARVVETELERSLDMMDFALLKTRAVETQSLLLGAARPLSSFQRSEHRQRIRTYKVRNSR